MHVFPLMHWVPPGSLTSNSKCIFHVTEQILPDGQTFEDAAP